MGRYSLALDDLGSHMEEQAPGMLTESRVEPILDWDDWRGEGRLVESLLERVVVVTLNHDTLALSDISVRRRRTPSSRSVDGTVGGGLVDIYWRQKTIRSHVSEVSGSSKLDLYFTEGKVTIRRELIERGGSSEAWYGGR